MSKLVDFQLKTREVKKYFEEYVTEYRKFLNEKHPERIKTDFLFTKYPLKIRIYFDERGIEAYYKQAKEFGVEVCGKIPISIEKGWTHWQSISSRYFPAGIGGAKKNAINDILSEIEYEETEGERQKYLEEYLEEEYYKFLEEETEEEINNFLEYIEFSNKVLEETLEKNKRDVRSAIKINNYHLYEMDFYLEARLLALFETFHETRRDLDSTIFLALHGRYENALTVLRRFLETVIYSVYFDSKISKVIDNKAEYRKVYDDFQKWYKDPDSYRDQLSKKREGFGVFRKIINEVIDRRMNQKASVLFKKTIDIYDEKDFEGCVYHIFKDLSKHVHYGGKMSFEWSIDFSKYDEKLFLEWFDKFKQVKEICDYIIILKFPESLKLFEKLEGKGFPEIPKQHVTVTELRKFYNIK